MPEPLPSGSSPISLPVSRVWRFKIWPGGMWLWQRVFCGMEIPSYLLCIIEKQFRNPQHLTPLHDRCGFSFIHRDPMETWRIMLPPSLRCPAPRGMVVDFSFESAPTVNLIFSRIAWGTRVDRKDESIPLLRYPASLRINCPCWSQADARSGMPLRSWWLGSIDLQLILSSVIVRDISYLLTSPRRFEFLDSDS